MADGRRGVWLVVAAAPLFWFVAGCHQELSQDELLIQQLAHMETNERWNAALSIREMRPVRPQFIPPLIQALDDQDPRVRFAAAEALGEVGAEGRPFVNEMAKLSTSHPDSQVRFALQRSLTKISQAQ